MKLVLNRFLHKPALYFFAFVCISILPLKLNAQANLQVTILSGSSTTTCTDFLSAPDPLFSVDVDYSGWVTYPLTGNCYIDLPNMQYESFFRLPLRCPYVNRCMFQSF